jgi:hypothetical protein
MSEETASPTPVPATDAPATPTTPPQATTPAAERAAGEGTSAPAVDTASEWQKHLESANPEDLRRHPKVAGLVGDMVDKAMRRWRAEQDAEVSQRAAQQAEHHLLTLAKEDPEAFAERFLTDKQRETTLRQINRLREDTRAEFAHSIGRAYQDAPGWDEIDHEALAKAIANKPDDEVIPAFHKEAMRQLLDLNASRKAKAEFETWKEKELAKEREAIRKEVAADLLKKGPRPDMTRGRNLPTARAAWMDLPPGPEFDAAYEREVLGRS